MNPTERYSRQAAIVPANKIKDISVSVIGVGAIGRNVAIQLASIGVNNLRLIDFDSVDESNICTQGYTEKDIGKSKVEVTAETCRQINSAINIELINGRFRKTQEPTEVVFCCVDSIETRGFIFDALVGRTSLFIDGRMTAEALRILTVDSEETAEYYKKTLFPENEATRGACTAKTTIFCANIASGLMVSRLAKWLREIPNEKDFMVNLLSDELILVKEE